MKQRIQGCGILLVLLLACGTLFGQTAASITGTVTDQSGAVIPNATVTVTDAEKGTTHSVATNTSGTYLFGLDPGTYNIGVTANGFQKFSLTNIVLHAGEQLRKNASLQVGAVQNEVTVSETPVAVQTESSALAGTVTGTEVQNLELNGRNYTQLITLVPGVSNQTGQDEGTVGVYGNINYSVNGGRLEENNWQVDGGNIMDNGSNQTINVYPSVDAIGEVQVITNSYGAQYGGNANGTVIAATKSGTNQFHGDAYEFLRNEALNARSFFDVKKPLYRKNDYGYTFGGPIKRDKLFFFWSEEWRKQKDPTTYNTPLPNTAFMAGNFTSACPAAGATPTAANKTAFPNCPIVPAFGPDAAMAGSYFPNYQVPVDPNAAALLSAAVPAPTTVEGGQPFVHGSVSEPTNWREELVRVDYNINHANQLYGRFIHDSWSTTVPYTLWSWNNYPTNPTDFKGPGETMVAHLVTTINPHMVNEFVANYSTDWIALTNKGNVALPSSFTGAGIFNNGFGGKLPAYMMCGNATDGGCWFWDSGDEPWFNSNPTFEYHDQITQNVGNHNLYYGVAITTAQKNEMGGQEIQPLYQFGTWATCTTNEALADMLYGCIANVGQSNIQPKYYDRYKIVSPFVQDDWHVTPRLTLNLGLREEGMGTYYSKYPGLVYNFQPNAWNPAAAPKIVNGNLSGGNFFNGLVGCGQNGVPKGCIKGHLFNLSPRIGFAYDLSGNGKTALRAGYGIFYDHLSGNESIDNLRNPPAFLNPSAINVRGYTALAASAGAGTFGPLTLGASPEQITWPYVQQWHADIQHEFPGRMVVTTSYVGSKGTDLSYALDLNQFPAVPAAQNPFYPGNIALAALLADGNSICTDFKNSNFTTVTLPNGLTVNSGSPAFQDLNNACGNDPSPNRKFRGYKAITQLTTGSDSFYHALQVSARRSYRGLDLNVAYTWSHAIDTASDYGTGGGGTGGLIDPYDLRLSRASSAFDQRHILNFAYVYQLPIFSGNRWLGGWSWSGITTMQTGTPFTVLNSNPSDNAGVASSTGQSWPMQVGDPNAPLSAAELANAGTQLGPIDYNPAAFRAPVGLTFGQAGRNNLREPGRVQFDMGLFKRFKVTERQNVEFRAEGYNIFNHPQLYNIANSISCYGTDLTAAGTPPTGGNCMTQNNFLHPTAAHLGRVLQFALKYSF